MTEEQCIDLNYSKLVPCKDWGQNFTIKDILASDSSIKEAVFL